MTVVTAADHSRRFSNDDMAKGTPFVNKLISELRNEIPEDFALNRHAPLQA